ncbi:MAG: hypothetical protein OHK0045_00810 [Raineya sp.]
MFIFIVVVSETVAQKTITLYGRPVQYYSDGSIDCGKKNGICAEIRTEPSIDGDDELVNLEPAGRVLLRVAIEDEKNQEVKFLELFINPDFEIKQIQGRSSLRFNLED